MLEVCSASAQLQGWMPHAASAAQVPPEQRLPLLMKGGLNPDKDLENLKLIFQVGPLVETPALRLACMCMQPHAPIWSPQKGGLCSVLGLTGLSHLLPGTHLCVPCLHLPSLHRHEADRLMWLQEAELEGNPVNRMRLEQLHPERFSSVLILADDAARVSASVQVLPGTHSLGSRLGSRRA